MRVTNYTTTPKDDVGEMLVVDMGCGNESRDSAIQGRSAERACESCFLQLEATHSRHCDFTQTSPTEKHSQYHLYILKRLQDATADTGWVMHRPR